MTAKAKKDIQVLMNPGHFCDFIEGKRYRFIYRGDNEVVLMDENKNGYLCTRKEFEDDFEDLIY